MRSKYFLALVGILYASQATAQSSTVTDKSDAKLPATAACEVSGSAVEGIGVALLDFGTTSLLATAIETGTGISGVDAFNIQCSPGVPYTVSFDAGQNGTKEADRAMKRTDGSELVSYQLYSDAGRTTVLTIVPGAGTGSAQPIRVYGRVPAQPAPKPGDYRDVVTATVSF